MPLVNASILQKCKLPGTISWPRVLQLQIELAFLYLQRHPLIWALPIQAVLLLSNLDLLDPWNDEWFTLTTVSLPLDQILSVDPTNPPLYYLLLHHWIQLPWSFSALASIRLMSVLWALVATVLIYRFWLRREGWQFQVMFLALWVASPCLLLHARMGRSYSMQLALASVAIYTALRWAEQPRNWTYLVTYLGSGAALLYTHYLSGLAVAAGVCVDFLLKKRITLAAGQAVLLAVLFAPQMASLGSSLGHWIGAPQPYEGGNIVTDQIVRFAYSFMSFSFGETVSPVSLLLGIFLAPAVICALSRAPGTRLEWLPIVLVTAAIAWMGVSRFEPFVLMPSHLLFLLPFFLILIVRQMHPAIFVALLVLYACADYAYFSKNGFLVKPYAAPYKEMADIIRERIRGEKAVVAIDPWGSFTQPLSNRLGDDGTRVIFLNDEASARQVLDAAAVRPSVILLWRRTRDVSPGSFITKFEQDLSEGRQIRNRYFVRYGLLERWARRLLRGPGQSEYYYCISEFTPRDFDIIRKKILE